MAAIDPRIPEHLCMRDDFVYAGTLPRRARGTTVGESGAMVAAPCFNSTGKHATMTWAWIVDNAAFDRAVGIVSLLASIFALLAARSARQVAKETQKQIGQARLSVEVGKLRNLVESLRRGVRERNWDYASEKCSEILAQQAEMASRFENFDEVVQRKAFGRFATRIRSIGETCSTMMDTSPDIDIPRLGSQIDRQIEFLSTVYAASQQQVEARFVER